jgi:hypothetical protein
MGAVLPAGAVPGLLRMEVHRRTGDGVQFQRGQRESDLSHSIMRQPAVVKRAGRAQRPKSRLESATYRRFFVTDSVFRSRESARAAPESVTQRLPNPKRCQVTAFQEGESGAELPSEDRQCRLTLGADAGFWIGPEAFCRSRPGSPGIRLLTICPHVFMTDASGCHERRSRPWTELYRCCRT